MGKHTVCKVDELPVGRMRAFKAEGRSVLVYHLDDGFFATQANCTHVFAPLARGRIVDGCRIQCPLHRAQFDIRSGEVVEWANFPPGVQLLNVVRGEKALKTYPVSVVKGQVRIEI